MELGAAQTELGKIKKKDLYELHLRAHFSEIHVVLSEKQASIFLANANIWIEISDVCTSLWKWASDLNL